jgi:DNA-3-methyladenine glycosylase I
VIGNARRAEELADREGALAAFIWRYEPDPAD